MAKKDCIHTDGEPVRFTCQNARFRTDFGRGENHGAADTSRGSVFGQCLANHEGYTLWLEYVAELKEPNGNYYWLMWYDSEGYPTIPLSGIMSREEVVRMIQLFAERSLPASDL